MVNNTGFTVNAVLCDSAVTADGKLFLQGGGWDVLTANGFPFQQPRIGLGAVVAIPYTATNQNHRFSLELVSEDGQPVHVRPAPSGEEGPNVVDAQFNIGRPPHLQPGDSQSIAFAVNLDQLRFDGPGSFAFIVKIDRTEVERLPFRVMLPRGMATVAGT